MSKLENTLCQLKFTAKSLSRQAKKAQKDENVEKPRLKKALQQGNNDGARIYASNAIRKKSEALNLLRLASRIDAVASRVETAVTMRQVTGNMTSVVKGMDKAMETMNLERCLDPWQSLPQQVLRECVDHGNDGVSLAIFIHVAHQSINSESWIGLLRWSLPQFDILNTLPEVQHEFCALWNLIVQEARSKGFYSDLVDILREIRHLYLALHEDTDTVLPVATSTRSSHHRIHFATLTVHHPTVFELQTIPSSSLALQQTQQPDVFPGLPSSSTYPPPAHGPPFPPSAVDFPHISTGFANPSAPERWDQQLTFLQTSCIPTTVVAFSGPHLPSSSVRDPADVLDVPPHIIHCTLSPGKQQQEAAASGPGINTNKTPSPDAPIPQSIISSDAIPQGNDKTTVVPLTVISDAPRSLVPMSVLRSDVTPMELPLSRGPDPIQPDPTSHHGKHHHP
ncbi:hypothetical protein BC827DRAFT_1269022 [Russula dissimulans]|nr:hypothetical protein BC827DRAFT_1269022 [Russula dissimulans]